MAGNVEAEELEILMRVHKHRWQYARLIRLWCAMAQSLIQQLGVAMLTGSFVTWRETASTQALARRHGMLDDAGRGAKTVTLTLTLNLTLTEVRKRGFFGKPR